MASPVFEESEAIRICALFIENKNGNDVSELRPVAPFDKNPADAGKKAFDRDTGKRVAAMFR